MKISLNTRIQSKAQTFKHVIVMQWAMYIFVQCGEHRRKVSFLEVVHVIKCTPVPRISEYNLCLKEGCVSGVYGISNGCQSVGQGNTILQNIKENPFMSLGQKKGENITNT